VMRYWKESSKPAEVGVGLFDGDKIIVVEDANPAAGEWQTDVSLAPVGKQILTEDKNGQYSVYRISFPGILKSCGVARFAIINEVTND
jgi:hypothetical protein